jgi:hypothetical protein
VNITTLAAQQLNIVEETTIRRLLSAVKVTGALLAEAASVVDGKLDVRGECLL